MSLTDIVLWITGFLLSCALLLTLTVKKRWRIEPWFASWVTFNIVSAISLCLAMQTHRQRVYAVVYWFLAAVDLALQVGVVFELARSVLTRREVWVANSGFQFRTTALLSLIPSACLAMVLRPAAESPIDDVYARCNLFMTLLVCSMFLAVISASKRFGLAWQEHTQKLGYGLLCWNLCSFVTDTLHYYWPVAEHFSGLEYVRVISFQLATGYWILISARTSTKAQEDTQSVPTLPPTPSAEYRAQSSFPVNSIEIG